MKYPIHVDNSFRNRLKDHTPVGVLNIESQSNDSLKPIIDFCNNSRNGGPIMVKLDVNIYHRIIRTLHQMEKEGEDVSWFIPIFPNWHIMEYFIKCVLKN